MPLRRFILTLLFILSIILGSVAFLLGLTTGVRGFQFYLGIITMIAMIVTLVMYWRQTSGKF